MWQAWYKCVMARHAPPLAAAGLGMQSMLGLIRVCAVCIAVAQLAAMHAIAVQVQRVQCWGTQEPLCMPATGAHMMLELLGVVGEPYTLCCITNPCNALPSRCPCFEIVGMAYHILRQ